MKKSILPLTFIGVLLVLLVLLWVFILDPVILSARYAAARTKCHIAVSAVGKALDAYLGDFDNVFPGVQDQATFQKLMAPYSEEPLAYQEPKGYAIDVRFNTRLANVNLTDIPDPSQAIELTSPIKFEQDKRPWEVYMRFADGHFSQVSNYPNLNDPSPLLDRNYPRVSQTFLPIAAPRP